MLARGLSIKGDEYWLPGNSKIISLGLDMLSIMLRKTPAIRPTPFHEESTNPIHRWAHSAHGLQLTIRKLLSHVVRISCLEMTGDGSRLLALKYPSLEVMSMTRLLIQSYSLEVQVEAVSILCKKLKDESELACLLPRVIDFIRPIVMDMCGNSEQYNRCSIVYRDINITTKISNILDPFLEDMQEAIGDPKCLVPRDVPVFMMATETYSAVFAVIRLLKLWNDRVQATRQRELEPGEANFQGIARWVESALSKLRYFDSCLTGLINIWEASSNPPHDWHMLFLLQSTLRDAFNV